MWSREPFSVIFLAITATWCKECRRGKVVPGEFGDICWRWCPQPSCWCWNLLNFDLIYLGDCPQAGEFSGDGKHCQYLTSIDKGKIHSIRLVKSPDPDLLTPQIRSPPLFDSKWIYFKGTNINKIPVKKMSSHAQIRPEGAEKQLRKLKVIVVVGGDMQTNT